MATANDLLKTLVTQPDPEGHIVVGGDRFITVPENLKRLGVQFDHNMETVTFDCPRYWDDRDMTKMAVYVNYRLSNGYTDRYPVDGLRADGDIMHFEWTISRNVTEVPGIVSFLICVMKTDAQGIEERHWNSELNSDCYISVGMEPEEHPALMYPDEVTQLLLRMATVEQINVQAQEMEQILSEAQETAALAEETKNQALDASNYIKNSYAPAIKGNVSGKVVRIGDVSPIEHSVAIKVRSKNLANPADFQITKSISGAGPGATIDLIDNTAMATNPNIPVSGSTQYIFTLDNTNYFLDRICEMDKDELCTYNHAFYFTPDTADFSSRTWTTKPETTHLAVRLKNKNGMTPTLEELTAIKLMITEYVTEDSGVYEPFIDSTTTTVFKSGKNILQSIQTEHKVNGLTVSPYKDGRICITGSISGTEPTGILYLTPFAVDLPLHKDVPYKLSLYKNEELYKGTIGMRVTYPSGTVIWNTLGDSSSDRTLNYVYLFHNDLAAGNTSLSGYWKLQLEVGETVTSWERYVSENTTPSDNGACVVISIDPNMTIYTDTPGAIIEAEYNRDTTKMFESYVLTDNAKSEIASIVENDMAEVMATLNEYATSLIGGGA